MRSSSSSIRTAGAVATTLSAALLAATVAAGPAGAAPGGQASANGQTAQVALERQVLGENDGWGSAGSGTTGGADAAVGHVYDVDSRAGLLAAFDEAGDAPKIIRVHGVIDGNEGPDGAVQTCDAYAEGTGYDFDAYLEEYSPENWGWDEEPHGVLEDARDAAAENQKNWIRWDIPSNTTIVGADAEAGITGAALRASGEQNIIIRNLTISDSRDCFPGWDPTDGSSGNWNSEYDLLQIINGTENVWLDHNTFTDAPNFDDELPEYFGRTFQVHDGAVDVTNGSNFVTMSYNRFENHDKLMLIGSTDSPTRGDPGKLKVTIHHNVFKDIGQRAPRVRYGQVDVYNNHFVLTDDSPVAYGYLFGAGVESHLYATDNAITGDIDPATVIKNWKGDAVYTDGNTLNGKKVDLLAAHNDAVDAETQLGRDDSWAPERRTTVHAAQAVPALLADGTGPIFTAGE
ncbi:pectate lyase family protein [Zhihengliuella halotolerans]|uniref:pectate lyase family protein n=1 Tax=Zhihengliuella halotolerans TaxID=370736 RepID=UPI000C809EAF|nr:pectate lyase [Zhihengliuella halotolerans]